MMTEDRDRPDERPGNGADDVAHWIKIGGRRPSADAERTDRVRVAAHAHWKQSVRRRTRTRRLRLSALAAAASLILAGALWVLRDEGISTNGTRLAAHVTASDGGTRIDSAGATSRPVNVDEPIEIGAVIWTDGVSRVAIALQETGHSVRIDHDTRVRLVGAETLVLEQGAIYIDSGVGRANPIPVRVETPLGVVQDIGTQFEIRLDGADAMQIRVREGAVVVRGEGGTHRVGAATELWLPADGAPVTRPIDVHGPAWDWVLRFVPPPVLDGSTALEFLQWAAREGGWTLTWADDAAAATAGEARLGGTVEGLSVDEALSAVLPTCGLSHRIDRGRLEVSTESANR